MLVPLTERITKEKFIMPLSDHNGDTSGQSASGKLDFVSNHRLPIARSHTDDITTRVRYDVLFDIDTQLPAYIFAPGRRSSRYPKYGSLTKWNTAWT